MRVNKSSFAHLDADQHIASLLLHVSPQQLQPVMTAIGAIDGLEISQQQDGRVIVLAEAESNGQLADQFAALQAMAGVLSLNLIYHHTESAAALDEPVPGDQTNLSEIAKQ
ncbi:MAG: hypothetical protein DHS20C11_27890 [Lysobacteraceae bacterium]|nr:MAG: hypothetical protein DHS20C11_27890 [Xanthomonadaceae bacterium]